MPLLAGRVPRFPERFYCQDCNTWFTEEDRIVKVTHRETRYTPAEIVWLHATCGGEDVWTQDEMK